MKKGIGIGFTFLRFYTLILVIYLFNINTGTSQVQINEVLTVNATFNYDPQYYNYPSWIELYNTSGTSVNMGGYYLTDSKTNKTKWALPSGTYIGANGYLTIWCDNENVGLHTNFKLDSDGETIYLYNGSLALQDSINLPQQYSNVSFGRLSNSITWGYLLTPTPTAANGTADIFGLISPPTFSLPSGKYASAITLNLSSIYPGVQIRYTLDGSEPTQQSTLFSSDIVISQTKVVKAKIFSAFAIPSETVTRTYFINEHTFTLPVFSVSLNPTFLWDNTIGMHVTGTNGIAGNCSDQPQNYNRNWGRYCVVELFDKTGNSQFKKDFDTKIYGACSRHYFAQKSLAFYTRSEYGKGHLEHKLFETKNLDRFDAFILRNSGNDFNVSMFRDALMQSLIIGKLDIDWQAYQPATVYLNGIYWGIMNIREKLDEDYIEHNGRVDKDSIDFLETAARATTSIIEGSDIEYNDFLNSLGTIDLSTRATYDYIDSKIDLDNYIHYYIAQIYYVNTDWPGNNIKFWKSKKQGSKWRWIIFDTDFGFSNATHNTLNFVTDSTTTVDWPNPQHSTLLFRRLIKNPYFRERFIQTFLASINYVFKPERVHKVIDSIAGLISAEMVYHKQKYGGTVSNWNSSVQNFKNFAVQRYSYMQTHLAQFFNINLQTASVNASVKQINTGKVVLNGIQIETMESLKLYYSIPYEICAVPADGYQFKEWKIITSLSSTQNIINKGSSWKYHDQGQNLNTAWYGKTYDDASWAAGNAQLGYGDGDENTVISFGTNASNKYITAYFRKTVNITDTTNIRKAIVNLLCDDGAVIYLNGIEVARYNMPAGTIAYNTLASSAAAEGVYVEFSINPKILVPGANTLAVEIHQNSVSSTDTSFDMDFIITKTTQTQVNYSSSININGTVDGDITYIAEFETAPPVGNIFINEISAKQSNLTDNYGNSEDWFELYNATSDTVDLIGLFLTDNFTNPVKFKIWSNNTNNTKIAPNSYYVFWADEEEHQGNKHCSFKLSGDGERLGIFQIVGDDTLAIDTITYGTQYDYNTFGCYPDGVRNYIYMSTLTPYLSNIYAPLDVITINKADTEIILYPNPVSTQIQLLNLSEPIKNNAYRIIDYMGRLILHGTLDNNQVDCSKLIPGVYIIDITLKGKRWNKKFIKE